MWEHKKIRSELLPCYDWLRKYETGNPLFASMIISHQIHLSQYYNEKLDFPVWIKTQVIMVQQHSNERFKESIFDFLNHIVFIAYTEWLNSLPKITIFLRYDFGKYEYGCVKFSFAKREMKFSLTQDSPTCKQ